MNWKRLLIVAAAGYSLASAQEPAPDPCALAQSAEFDFWVGDWDVFVPSGKLAGTNRVERLYGCVLHESWKSAKIEGQSFSRFDAERGVWHQTWVDSTGSLLLLEGGLRGGAMVLGDRSTPGRKPDAAVNEVSWSRNEDGSVRQHWRATKDGGRTWETVFDGKYVRSGRPQPR